ncbi:protein lin-54 homolog isoform X1 [Mya arenaria]|uniref:protein lin-54 homolog isoform X1 n=1 Tax=Mya arenaria TaxID=6604 RepID=UPI0022E8DF76|nr:protein lin-54 homolog isoform X1 [Mya arenaria]
MPTQELASKDDRHVKVLAVDSVTGAVLTSVHHSDGSSAADSIDGNLPLDTDTFEQKQNNSLQMNIGDDVIDEISPVISSTNDTVTGDSVVQLNPHQFQEIVASSTLNLASPQVIVVDANNRNSLLGKRPISGNGNQPSVTNKIIITKLPNSSQVQTVIASQSANILQGTSVVSTNPHTPTKTITLSQHGIVSPLKGVSMAQVAGAPKVPISKLPLSPAKTPTKITMIPRSPQRIAPANIAQTLLNNNSVGSSSSTITLSPSKIIKQPGTVTVIQKPVQPSISGATVVTIPRPASAQAGVRQPVAAGNKFHYIRLANPASSAPVARGQLIAVTAGTSGQPGAQPMKITLPAHSVPQLVTSRPGGTALQRIILPAAPNQVSIRPAPGNTLPGAQLIRTTLAPTGTGLQQISTGGATTFLSTGSTGPQGVQGFALVPASYLSQLQGQLQLKPATVATPPASQTLANQASSRLEKSSSASYQPIAPSGQTKTQVPSADASGGARQRKPCNCTKSQCLKLYCDCFANGEFCHNCNCNNCANNLDHEEDRSRAIKQCLERNPLAFHPKIGKGRAGEKDRRHNKGCNCKRSGCLKNYCECYEAKIMCNSSCKCVGCKNFEESPERKTLMHLADAAEVRVQQQTAAKSKLSSQISDLPTRPPPSGSGERLPFSFVTSEVVEATCACLLAQAEEGERQKMPHVVQERMVIEEFGRCLLQIIESANRTKAPDPDDTG